MENESSYKVLKDRKTIFRGLGILATKKAIITDSKKTGDRNYVVIETPRPVARQAGAKKRKLFARYSRGKLTWHRDSK